jgi:hypothetical protein
MRQMRRLPWWRQGLEELVQEQRLQALVQEPELPWVLLVQDRSLELQWLVSS